jgi:hypothetical protein
LVLDEKPRPIHALHHEEIRQPRQALARFGSRAADAEFYHHCTPQRALRHLRSLRQRLHRPTTRRHASA